LRNVDRGVIPIFFGQALHFMFFQVSHIFLSLTIFFILPKKKKKQHVCL
jgi:hypothetical protein